MPTKKWTEEEEDFLKNNYMIVSNADIAEKYDITKNAVQKKLARMGLKRSKTVKEPEPAEVTETETVEEEEREVVSTESHFFMGNKLYHEERNYEQAIEEYRQAAKKESNELIKLKARYWMAESYVKVGKVEAAMALFNRLAKGHGGSYLGDSAKRRAAALAEII